MLYEITYIRNGKTEVFTGTRAQCQALADYVWRTFRIQADVHIVA